MSAQANSKDYVKKEITIMVGLIALVAGFLGGVVYSSINSDATVVVQQTSTMPPQQGQSGISPDLARRIITLEKEVAANPNNAGTWASLGHVYFDTNKVQKAIKAYNKSLAIVADNPDVWTDLGVMYRRNKQFDEAIDAFNKAIAGNPKHEQARFNKGIVLMYDKGDKAAAIKAWEELMKINPAATAPNGQSIKQIIAGAK